MLYTAYTFNYAPYLGFYSGAPYVLNSPVSSASHLTPDQAIQVSLWGLKPNTQHYVYVGDVDVSNRAKQVGKLLGDGLVTDASGAVTFTYYLGSNLTSATSVQQAAALADAVSGAKTMVARSADGASSATVPLNIPDYARNELQVSFKKTIDGNGNTALTVVTASTTGTPDAYFTPQTYSHIQTFYADPDAVGGAGEITLTSVDLFFKSKPTAYVNTGGMQQPSASIAICEVENDSPVISKTYVSSVAKKSYDEIYSYSDASTPTTFGLATPLKLSTGKSYGVVVILDDAHYTLWTNVTGNNLVGTNTKSPGSNLVKDGNLFARNTSGIFTARTNEDLKFGIKIAKYSANTATLTFVNGNYEFLTMANSVHEFLGGEFVYKEVANSVGTIVVGVGSTGVTGTGTSFTSHKINDTIVVENGDNVSQVMVIDAIANNTFLEVRDPSPISSSGGTYRLTCAANVLYKQPNENKLFLQNSNANTIVFAPGDYIVGEDSGTRAQILSVDEYSVDRIKIKSSVKDSIDGDLLSNLTLATRVGSDVAVDDTQPKALSLNDIFVNNLSTANSVIQSRSIEVTNSSLYSNTSLAVVNKSLKIDVAVTGTPYVSPSLPDMKIDCFTIQNKTSNTTISGSTDSEIYNNTANVSRHIEKKITFAENRFAEDVRMYVKAYRPVGTDIKVYARLHNSQDTDAFDDKNWTPLEYKTGEFNYSSSNDQTDFIEYELGLPQFSPTANTLPGTFTATLNSAVVAGNGVTPSTYITSNDLVKVYSDLFPDNHWVGSVSSANSTHITLNSPITSANVTGTGFKVDKLKYKNIAFNNINNSNVCRYYGTNMSEYDTYDSMQIKVVFVATNTYLVPRVDQIQVIGVSA